MTSPSESDRAIPGGNMTHNKYGLAESGPLTGHWVCECGVDLGDCPIDEIDEVFAAHLAEARAALDGR